MAVVGAGIQQVVYNGTDIVLQYAPWLNNVRSIYTVNAARTGWNSYVPGSVFNSLTRLVKDGFYLFYNHNSFDLPDAQLVPCATYPADVLLPVGLSQFLYTGTNLALNTAPWIGSVNSVYRANGTGWSSYIPGQVFNSLNILESGRFYLLDTSGSFSLAGAQITACEETFGIENPDATQFVKYPDLLGAIPETADPKTAPNMPLFKATIAALGATHHHDDRYYQKTETLTTAEINAILQGVDEVIEVATFADLPATGLASKLYMTAEPTVGYRWNGTGYSAVSAPGVDLTPYLTKTEAGNTYQLKGDYLTIAAGDTKYAFKGDAWTKTEADNRFQFKGNYAPAGNYVKEIIFNGVLYLPDSSGRIVITANTGTGGGFDNGYVGKGGDMYDNGYVSK